ncbi:MAG: hypothetical protein AB1432_16260 [Bacteroidota bacterium]
MKFFMITHFILLTFIMISCKDNSVDPLPVKYDPLIPLSVGNYWLYQGYYLYDDGSVNFPQDYKYGFIVSEPPLQLNDRKDTQYYQVSYCGEDLKPIDDSNWLLYGGSKLVHQDNNGFYYAGIVRKDTVTMTFSDLIFPYPTKEGKSTSGHVFYYSTLGNYSNVPDDVITQYTCVSTDSLFSTPFGDFRCIVYKMAYQDFEPLFRDDVYYFIKPGLGIVGIVQMVYHYSSNKYSYLNKHVLTQYKIN